MRSTEVDASVNRTDKNERGASPHGAWVCPLLPRKSQATRGTPEEEAQTTTVSGEAPIFPGHGFVCI